jgi:hypothetical protein
MPVNAGPEYIAAEKKYLLTQTPEEKIACLEEMIRVAPKHKSSENFVAELKKRLKKLVEQLEKSKKKGKGKPGIKKEDLQAVIIGETNIGKSRLMRELTNASPKIGNSVFEQFTTKEPVVGMLDYNGVPIQLIENPAIESEYYDRGLTNSSDVLIILFREFSVLERIESETRNYRKKKIFVFMDNLNESPEQLRKIASRLQSRRYDSVMINLENKQGLEELKEKIFQGFGKIRIFTKEPGRQKSSSKPIILQPESNVKNVAEKILHGFSSKVKETRIWGPSSKYPGQVVSLAHKLKDLDVVEFKTK